MVVDGSIAQTPEQLDAWISEHLEVSRSLERGGYSTKFTSHDLFPLLQVFVVQAGGPAPQADAPPPPSKRGRLVGLGLAALALILIAIAIVALR
jgi:hypothetical protein